MKRSVTFAGHRRLKVGRLRAWGAPLWCGLALALAAPLAPAARAQGGEETDPVKSSRLVGATVPAGAVRMREVPAQMKESLAQFVRAAGLRQGESEVLAWQGAGYKKANAPKLLGSLKTTMGKAGWQFETNDTGQGFQILTIGQPGKRVFLGIWVPADEAAILAWTEVFKGDTQEAPGQDEVLPDAAGEAEPAAQDEPAEAAAEEEPQDAPAAPAAAPKGAIVHDLDATTKTLNVMGRAKPKTPAFAKLAAKKGFVRGFVKDAKGKPLSNAKLGVRSTAVGGAYSGAQGKTDAKGYYEIAVPFGVAHFYNAGYAVEYGEGRVAMGLHPADGELDSFASNVGHVENFVLLGHGIADPDDVQDNPQYVGNYYGGGVVFDWNVEDDRFPNGRDLPANSQIEITLSPQGALLDGSTGKSIVIRKRIGTWFGQLYVTNIPSGTYRLSAKLVGGGALKLKETGPYSSNPFGLSPKEAQGAAILQLRPGTAKADMATGGKGGWSSVSVSLSR
jgi:hypothetical protein